MSILKLISGLILLTILGCSTNKSAKANKQFEYSINKPIEGQIETAKRLKTLMDEKKYDLAIKLFSKKQQLKIEKIKTDEEVFKYWCSAWTMSNQTLERYIEKIKNGKGIFVFEDGQWKVDEN